MIIRPYTEYHFIPIIRGSYHMDEFLCPYSVISQLMLALLRKCFNIWSTETYGEWHHIEKFCSTNIHDDFYSVSVQYLKSLTAQTFDEQKLERICVHMPRSWMVFAWLNLFSSSYAESRRRWKLALRKKKGEYEMDGKARAGYDLMATITYQFDTENFKDYLRI